MDFTCKVKLGQLTVEGARTEEVIDATVTILAAADRAMQFLEHMRDEVAGEPPILVLEGGHMSKDTIQIVHSNVTGSPIKSAGSSVSITSAAKGDIDALLERIRAALPPVVAAQPDDAERLAATTSLLASELKKQEPNRSFLKISADGLMEAAKAVRGIAPAVLEVAELVASRLATLR